MDDDIERMMSDYDAGKAAAALDDHDDEFTGPVPSAVAAAPSAAPPPRVAITPGAAGERVRRDPSANRPNGFASASGYRSPQTSNNTNKAPDLENDSFLRDFDPGSACPLSREVLQDVLDASRLGRVRLVFDAHLTRAFPGGPVLCRHCGVSILMHASETGDESVPRPRDPLPLGPDGQVVGTAATGGGFVEPRMPTNLDLAAGRVGDDRAVVPPFKRYLVGIVLCLVLASASVVGLGATDMLDRYPELGAVPAAFLLALPVLLFKAEQFVITVARRGSAGVQPDPGAADDDDDDLETPALFRVTPMVTVERRRLLLYCCPQRWQAPSGSFVDIQLETVGVRSSAVGMPRVLARVAAIPIRIPLERAASPQHGAAEVVNWRAYFAWASQQPHLMAPPSRH
jgi:hypothetical protein